MFFPSGVVAATGFFPTLTVTAATATQGDRDGANSLNWVIEAPYGVFDPTIWAHPTLGNIPFGLVGLERNANAINFGLEGNLADANNVWLEFRITGRFSTGFEDFIITRAGSIFSQFAGPVGTNSQWRHTLTDGRKFVIGNDYKMLIEVA